MVDASGIAFQPSTFDVATFKQYLWGVGERHRVGADQTGSWAYSVLRSIEATTNVDNDAWGGIVPLLLCPTRGRNETPLAPVDDGFGNYRSGGHAMAKSDFCANSNVSPNRPEVRRFSSILDGLSQTIMLGEKAIDPNVQTEASWYWDEPFWLGGSKGTARSGHALFTDGDGIEFKENWSSLHVGGVNFTRVDGSSLFLTLSTDEEITKSYMTIAGQETVNE